ncbi:MAG: sigma-70 family RNA polymerase sigma factor [Planctomycetales bacterium]
MSTTDLVADSGSSPDPQSGWSAIIERARNGCRESFDVLARSCWGYLVLAARERIPPDLKVKVAPSDLVQQSLMVGYANFSQFRGTTEQDLYNWLEGILHRQALSAGRFYRNTHARSINREIPLLEPAIPADSNTPSELVVAQDQHQALLAAIEKLPPHYRTVLQLRSLEQHSFETIGTMTDRTPDAARKLWVAALRKLQKLMSSDYDPL